MNDNPIVSERVEQWLAAWREGRLGEERPGQVDLSAMEGIKREVDKLVRRDAREALPPAEMAVFLAEYATDPAARALAARMKGMVLHVLGRYAEALNQYEPARALYGEAGREVEAARIERAMVDALIYVGRYDEALAAADRARQVFARHGETLLLAQLESNAGNVYHRLDRNREALACYERATDLFAAADPSQLAQVTFNRANVYCNLDEIQRAQSLYEEALRLHGEQGNELGAAQTRYSLGYLHFRRGAYHQAMRELHLARREAMELGDEQTAALCVLDLAEIYLQSNVLDEAAGMATEARRLFESLGMRYEAARGLTLLALARLRQSNLDEAETCLTIAGEEFAAEGNRVQLGSIDLHRAELACRQGDMALAIRLAGEAEALFAAAGLKTRTVAAQLVRARALLLRGTPERALCEEIERNCQALESPWLSYQASELLGDLHLAEGDAGQARECLTRAIQFIERIRGGIRVEEFRSAFFRDKLRVFEKLIGLCLADDDPERQAEAFYFLESSKVRTLIDSMVNELEMAPAPRESASADLWRRWRELRERLHWHYSKEDRNESPDRGFRLNGERMPRREILECERELGEVTRQLQSLDPGFARLQHNEGLTVAELRALLRPDEVVLEYYFDGDRLKIFVIDREQLRVVDSGPRQSEIGEAIQRLRFQFSKFQYGPAYREAHGARMLRETNDCLHALWRMLIEPAANDIRGRNLIVVPFGTLHNIPFPALFDGNRYLVELAEIVQAPSASLLKLCADRSTGRFEEAAIFGAADELAPHISAEIEAIRDLFPGGKCFLGSEATSQALAAAAPTSEILHIASHAVFRQDSPMFSAFRLSDAWLNFFDIRMLKLPASLVTLSGCHTGASRVYAGDELMGLARGFLSAGAAHLVVSLWAVDDPATAELMTAFYRHLRAGARPRAALRQAALALKSNCAHPYYWAPFILISRD